MKFRLKEKFELFLFLWPLHYYSYPDSSGRHELKGSKENDNQAWNFGLGDSSFSKNSEQFYNSEKWQKAIEAK